MDRETFAGLLAARPLVCDGPLGVILGTEGGRPDAIPEMLALEDISRLKTIGVAGVIIGRALYEGKIKLIYIANAMVNMEIIIIE